MKHTRPLILLHRANDLSLLAPENMSSVDGIEVDLRMSRDGIVVLHHDRRVRNGDGRYFWIDTLTLSEAEEIDGKPMVRFEELLQKLKDPKILRSPPEADRASRDKDPNNKIKNPVTHLPSLPAGKAGHPLTHFILDLDLKQAGMEREIARLLKKYDVTNIVACSPDIWTLRSFEEAVPIARIGLTYVIHDRWDLITMKTVNFLTVLLSYSLKPFLFRLIRRKTRGKDIQIASMNYKHVSRQVVDFLHEYGIALYVWGTDREANLRHLVELGVDGIKTKRPDIARKLLE